MQVRLDRAYAALADGVGVHVFFTSNTQRMYGSSNTAEVLVSRRKATQNSLYQNAKHLVDAKLQLVHGQRENERERKMQIDCVGRPPNS